MRTRKFKNIAILVSSVLLLALSACGGNADSSTGGSGGDSDSLVKEMNDFIKEHSEKPKFTEPGPEFDAAKVEGKIIAIVAIDLRVPALSEIVKYVKEAADQLNLQVTVYDAKSEANRMQQGIQQAINNNADAIISDGLAIEVVTDQIKAAKDENIPVIDVINTPPKKGVPGQGSDPNIFGNFDVDTSTVGKLMAAKAIIDTDGKANVALMNTSELTASSAFLKSIKETLDKCNDCEIVKETDTALNDWSTKVQGEATTLVQTNPDLDYILTLYDGMGMFAVNGVEQAGGSGKVEVVSQDGTPAALEQVKNGDVFVADIARSTNWAAWGAVDQAMRGMLDMDPADPVLPARYLDSEALKGVNTKNSDAMQEDVFGDEYKKGYLKLWGIDD